ncbi:ABC transporter ATP-binding protein [Paractinoplanes ferrugineus]|uniref:ABC transporter n=1 Tax=Paractinoplanes ferrugineus TaxID=113564 RepID=A0A919MEX6_9ACTN|nr:ABC transporter ATP-binding protein [Actinoplanes ferrugineus]GIE13218.1 ABC transporter [Actinoplanes ferrugineus]
MTTLRAALRLGAGAHPAALSCLLALMLGSAALPVGAAWCTKLLLDEIGQGPDAQLGRAIRFAVLAAALVALATAANRLVSYLTAVVQNAVGIAANVSLYARVNAFLGLAPFEQPAFRDRLMLAQQAAEQAPYTVVMFAVGSAQSLVTIVSFAGVLLTLWPPAGLLVLAVAGPEFAIQLALARRSARATEQANRFYRIRFLYQGLLTDLRAVREIRLFQLGEFFHGRLTGALRRTGRIELDARRHAALVSAGWALASAAVALIGTVTVVAAVLRGDLTLGDLTIFLAAVGAVQSSLSGIAAQLGEVGASMRLFRHYAAVVHGPADLANGTLTAPPLGAEIRFEDVWFRYDQDGPWALRGLSLSIPAGRATGLVGVNGAGKSTLVKLLCRFYDPQRGRITWDGVDLREFDLTTLRARLGAVFQDFMCYDLTAEENVGIGRLPYSPDAVRRAATEAGVHDRLADLPHGYRTMLSRSFTDEDGETGVTLSGGQWQRVALARSLMRADADLLILDEPSSGLDAEAESRMNASLARVRQGRTGLLISHRLSTLRDADRILVLAAGQVAEAGSHDELMATGGDYSRLFTLQAGGYRLATP